MNKVRQQLEVSTSSFAASFMLSAANSSRFQWYRHGHARDMPLYEIARLLQTMLYARRFFPYYVYTILSGIEEDGELTTLLV